MFASPYGTVLHETLCFKRNCLGLPVHKNGLVKCSVWSVSFLCYTHSWAEKNTSIMLFLIIYCVCFCKHKYPKLLFEIGTTKCDNAYLCRRSVFLHSYLSYVKFVLLVTQAHCILNNYHIFVVKSLRKYWWHGAVFFWLHYKRAVYARDILRS